MSPGGVRRALEPLASTNSNTQWVFVAGKAEPRHLFDIIFGVHALRRRGVPDSSIWVFADHPATIQHFGPYGISNVFPVSEFAGKLPRLPPAELAVVVVTGHGDHAGICVEGGPSINATQLLGALRACPGVRGGVVLLGQCYAGLFNYTNAGLDPDAVHICLIGATSLNLSVSNHTTLPAPLKLKDGTDGLSQWIANDFVVRFFEWMLNPRDIDGDGRYSLMDAFKYASVMTNEVQRAGKGDNHILVGFLQPEVVRLEQALQQAHAAGADPKAIHSLMLEHGAKFQRLKEVLQNLYVHQEPWILHARFASAIELAGPALLAVASHPAPAPTTAIPAATP
jgi:hypothetical protein